jgi:glycosyltransferase involved in cell wall biosynthesis
MKLLILMPIASPWSRNLVLRICQNGHQVYVIDPSSRRESASYLNSNDHFQKDSINKFCNSVSGVLKNRSSLGYIPGLVSALFKTRKVAKNFNPDLLVVLYGGLWGLLAYLTRIRPYVVYVVGSDILRGGFIKKMITNKVLGSSDQVFSNGEFLKKEAQIISPKANIKNLYLGVDTKLFSPVAKNEELKINIICTRGFNEIYNNKYLIEGLINIPEQYYPALNVVFTSTGPLLEKVVGFYRKSSIYSKINVEFRGGVTDKELIDSLHKSHIYISLSISDGASISLMEALSCGLFPILSDIPANREWIKGDNGILVPLNNPKILAEMIIKVVNDSQLRSRAGTINRELIQNVADDNKNTFLFLEYLKSIQS